MELYLYSTIYFYGAVLNRLVQAETLLTCIPKAPLSNLGPDTEYPEIFRSSPEFLETNSGMVLQMMSCLLPYVLLAIQ
jgi:hypothetical protein